MADVEVLSAEELTEIRADVEAGRHGTRVSRYQLRAVFATIDALRAERDEWISVAMARRTLAAEASLEEADELVRDCITLFAMVADHLEVAIDLSVNLAHLRKRFEPYLPSADDVRGILATPKETTD